METVRSARRAVASTRSSLDGDGEELGINIPATKLDVLQRGRLSMETMRLTDRTFERTQGCWLQRGRLCEHARCPAGKPPPCWLQRSRLSMETVRVLVGHGGPRDQRASTRPPLDRDGEVYQPGLPPIGCHGLQRGRLSLEAVSGEQVAVTITERVASARPTLDEDGEEESITLTDVTCPMLQRGRLSMETVSDCAIVQRNRVFILLQRDRLSMETVSGVARPSVRSTRSSFNEAVSRRRR